MTGDSKFGVLVEGEGICSCCNLGGGNLAATGEGKGGGIEFFSGRRVGASGCVGVREPEYPREGCGGLAIGIQNSPNKDPRSRSQVSDLKNTKTIQTKTQL